MQGIENRLLAGIESLVAQALLLQADDDIIGIGIGDVADLLNGAVTQAFGRQALANLVDRRRPGKAHINQRAAAEIDSVAKAPRAKNRNCANCQKNQGQAHEILRLAHPINVDAVEQLHHNGQSYPSKVRHQQARFSASLNVTTFRAEFCPSSQSLPGPRHGVVRRCQ